MADKIIIKGAREHNLKNIDVEIPRDKLVVITGLSGSGKSSLAFDTIYAEGQRRYVESLSTYARQFLGELKKPDVDLITGLSPSISIHQKSASRNPRSTVGTVTEIYDYLRVLYANIGKPHCYNCGKKITSQTVQRIVDSIVTEHKEKRVDILAPIAHGKKGEFERDFEKLSRDGFIKVRIDQELYDLSSPIKLEKNKKHNIDVLIDRITIKDGITTRVTDSVETALRVGNGTLRLVGEDKKDELFSEKLACIDCGLSYPEITPQIFSFNSPYGACKECGGLGIKRNFDPKLIVPDDEKSLIDGAIAPWSKRSSPFYLNILESLAQHYKFSLNVPFKKLSEKVQNVLLYGSSGEVIEMGNYGFSRDFEGVIPNLDRRYLETDSDLIREEFEKYLDTQVCPLCKGLRLKKEGLSVKIEGKSISDLTSLSIRDAKDFLQNLHLSKKEHEISERILKEIMGRIDFLINVGLEYITIDRPSATLSGGESQRIRLATQIGSGLMGVLYVLDEPTIGLHSADVSKLIKTLIDLKNLGNTVIVVEHDRETIRIADQVIDMGLYAGREGGNVIFSGTYNDLLKDERSLTGKYLSGRLSIEQPKKRRKLTSRKIRIEGASGNNLKNIDLDIPLGLFIAVTGVSGSGKSTLIIDTLYNHLTGQVTPLNIDHCRINKIIGAELVDKIIDVDQSPIGRTPRSNPATYTGVFTPIRELFALLPESKARGYGNGRFSFNVKGGRCEECEGDGTIRIEMHFLPDIYVDCEVCHGARYNRDTLEIKYKGKNISDVLAMTIDEALLFFKNIPQIKSRLEILRDVGLGYVHLGQGAPTLSGGEAQRLKLARELAKRPTGRTLYILDEPTTGLHFDDIKKLLSVLNRLVDNSETVIVIEHNLDVIKNADYIIDLGPHGGNSGGEIVAIGAPEEIIKSAKSLTGKFLKNEFP